MTPVRLAAWSFGATCLVGTVCLTPIALGRELILAGGSSTPLWMGFSILFGMLGVYLNIRLIDEPFAKWASRLRYLLRYARAPFYAVGAFLMLNVWLTTLSGEQLELTPRIATALLLITTMSYALRLGVESSVRLLGLIGAVVAPTVFLLLGLALKHADLARLLPHPLGTGAIPWLWPTFLFTSRGFDLLPVFGPQVAPAQRHVAYVGVATGGVITFLSLVTPILVWGYAAASQLPHPLIKTIGTFASAYSPLQRVEFVSFITWQLTAFAVITMYAIAFLISLRVQVHPLTPWWAVAATASVTLAGALPMLPADMTGPVEDLWSSYGLLLFFVLPTALLLFGRLGLQEATAT